MLSAMCITIIVLNIKNEVLKSDNVCNAQYSNAVDIGSVFKKLTDYIGSVPNYVGVNRWFQNKTKQTFRDDFIRNVARGLNAIRTAGKGRDNNNNKQLVNVPQPLRKYKHFVAGNSAIQLIRAHGYKVETHRIPTYDGYMLTAHRILTSTRGPVNDTVILHHGLLGSSEDWLLLGPSRALPYMLSDQGYDVWLLNARGNKYSRNHDTFDADTFEFWDFSWHEMGVHDLPATITYINHYTYDANLYYIGHSMGATALLVLLSTYPEYNHKLKMAILLAPLAFMSHVKGPLRYFDDYHSQTNFYIGYKRKEFLANDTFPQSVISKYCQGTRKSCSNPLLLLANGGKEIPEPEMMYKVLTHVPAGGSTKTLIHYKQLIRSGHFQMFDYGMLNNLKYYRAEYPPKYNLASITLPILMFSSSSDWLSTVEDNRALLTRLGSVRTYDTIDSFDHIDFVWSRDATYMLYYVIIDLIDEDALRKKMNTLVTTMI